MSRLYQALRKLEGNQVDDIVPDLARTARTAVKEAEPEAQFEINAAHSVNVRVSPDSRLVALSDSKALGAEKFRALALRLETASHQRTLKSFQVTSSVANEGKSFVAANLAFTLANHRKSRVLLLDGDLHRPSLTSLFGLGQIEGISQWWSQTARDLTDYLYRLNNMSLWFLGAGSAQEQPSEILQSTRLSEAFTALTGKFDWIVVDSTPMLPVVDANLWSRLVDGTLLVVREGVTPVKALKKGLESLDNPKVIGVVLNDAFESDQDNYKYYGSK